MYQTSTQETMSQYDYQQQFEAAPQKPQSFHELFMQHVQSRREIVGRATTRLVRAIEAQKQSNESHSNVRAVANNAFMPFVEKYIPSVEAGNAIDEHQFLSTSGTVSVNPVEKNEWLNRASETEDDRVREARQHLAYIETLSELAATAQGDSELRKIVSQSQSLNDDNFTLAA